MLHQTLPILGQLWQLFEVSQLLEFLRYAMRPGILVFMKLRQMGTLSGEATVIFNSSKGSTCSRGNKQHVKREEKKVKVLKINSEVIRTHQTDENSRLSLIASNEKRNNGQAT